jgi:hypothetical protein
MSTSDYMNCPQCEFPQALVFDGGTYDHEIQCRNCGYENRDGEVLEGAGACGCYGADGSGVFYCLHSAEQIAAAVEGMREGFAVGKPDPKLSYVTRWNKTTKRLEVVLGRKPVVDHVSDLFNVDQRGDLLPFES